MGRVGLMLLVVIMTACGQEELVDVDYQEIGLSFVHALVEEDFTKAHKMLSLGLRGDLSQVEMAETYNNMIAYGKGPVKEVVLGEGNTEYPRKQPNDLGGVYISLIGDYFVEGVLVFVCLEEGEARIREITWGRP